MSNMKLGDKNIKAYVGDNEVATIFFGNDAIYKNVPHIDTPISVNWTAQIGTVTGTVTPVANATHYRVNSGSWQVSNVFAGLNPVTSYDFQARIAETATHAEAISGVYNDTSPKANQNAPAAPTASDITHNSVVITSAGNLVRQGVSGTLYSSPRTFTGLSPETQYSFYAVAPETSTLNQSGNSSARTITTAVAPIILPTGGGTVSNEIWNLTDYTNATPKNVWITNTTGNMLAQIYYHSCCGTQNASLSIGNNTGSGSTCPGYKFNGSTWSSNSSWNISFHASNNERQYMGICGVQDATLCFGGEASTTHYGSGQYNLRQTTKFNGSTWSTNSGWDLSEAHRRQGGCGTQSAALAFGGARWNGVMMSYVETNETHKFNGSTWSTDTGWRLNVSRDDVAGCGTQSAALAFGRHAAFNAERSEKFNGSVWAYDVNLNVKRRYATSFGTQNAAIAAGGWELSVGYALNSSEKFNGSSWTTVGNLSQSNYSLAGCGTSIAGLVCGGIGGTNRIRTEKFIGS